MSAKSKGNAYERLVANAYKIYGYYAERRPMGYTGDDLKVPQMDHFVSQEVKNQQTMKLASWLDQAVQQAGNRIAIVIHKRKGKPNVDDHYVTMRFSDWIRLMKSIDPETFELKEDNES